MPRDPRSKPNGRYWINAPSMYSAFHILHGKNGILADNEFFLLGELSSIVMFPEHQIHLVEGWVMKDGKTAYGEPEFIAESAPSARINNRTATAIPSSCIWSATSTVSTDPRIESQIEELEFHILEKTARKFVRQVVQRYATEEDEKNMVRRLVFRAAVLPLLQLQEMLIKAYDQGVEDLRKLNSVNSVP